MVPDHKPAAGGMATGYPAVPEELDPQGSREEADRLSLAGEILGQRQSPAQRQPVDDQESVVGPSPSLPDVMK